MNEKKVLESKKFLAYLLAELTWKAIILLTLLLSRGVLGGMDTDATRGWIWWFLVVVVVVAGFIECGFIGGQAWLDRYVYTAHDILQGPGAKKATGKGGANPSDGAPT